MDSDCQHSTITFSQDSCHKLALLEALSKWGLQYLSRAFRVALSHCFSSIDVSKSIHYLIQVGLSVLFYILLSLETQKLVLF